MESAAREISASIAARFSAWDLLRRPIWLFDPSAGTLLHANPAAVAFWGADTLDALLARDVSVLSPAVQARIARLVRVTANGGSIKETWTLYPNGSPVSTEATISTLALDDGRSVLLIEADRLEIDPEEVRAIEALRHTTTLISLFDPDGQPLFSNPAAFAVYAGQCRSFGERFVGLAVAKELWAKALDGTTAIDVCEVKTPGGVRWHHMVVTPALDPVTGQTGLLLTEHDVTVRVLAEQARAVAEQKAVMAEARQQFLSVMSHELKTPLNAILGFAEVMAHDSLPSRTLEQASRIHEAGRRVLTLVEEMIAVSSQDVLEPGAETLGAASIAPETANPFSSGAEASTRVLYVDDNENNRTLVATILATQGLSCTTAEDGLQGLEAVEQGDFDLILMDIAMPVMDGVEASRRIRALPGAKSSVPIVAVTANTLPEQLASYAAVGIDDVLAKPITMSGLLTAVSVWSGARTKTALTQAIGL